MLEPFKPIWTLNYPKSDLNPSLLQDPFGRPVSIVCCNGVCYMECYLYQPYFASEHVMYSVAVIAGISVKSPRKVFICIIIKKQIHRIKVSQKITK